MFLSHLFVFLFFLGREFKGESPWGLVPPETHDDVCPAKDDGQTPTVSELCDCDLVPNAWLYENSKGRLLPWEVSEVNRVV